jgi:hypothetical protein
MTVFSENCGKNVAHILVNDSDFVRDYYLCIPLKDFTSQYVSCLHSEAKAATVVYISKNLVKILSRDGDTANSVQRG